MTSTCIQKSSSQEANSDGHYLLYHVLEKHNVKCANKTFKKELPPKMLLPGFSLRNIRENVLGLSTKNDFHVGGSHLITGGFAYADFHLTLSHPKILVKQLEQLTG